MSDALSNQPDQAEEPESTARSFMMGEFEAVFPAGLRYTTNHMWARAAVGSAVAGSDSSWSTAARWRFGLTAYAVRLLQDVYFLDWIVEPPTTVARRDQMGSIESKKAESDLYSPASGQIVALNPAALADPSVINVDIYGDGWLFELELHDTGDLLEVDAYLQHLEQAWVVAQRTIKGQI